MIAALRQELTEVNRSIADLVEQADVLRAKHTLEGIRQCMMVIHQLYGAVDMTLIHRETDLLNRCHQSMEQCQNDLEKVFGPFSAGFPVDQEDLRCFALGWMNFHQNHVDLTDYIQDQL